MLAIRNVSTSTLSLDVKFNEDRHLRTRLLPGGAADLTDLATLAEVNLNPQLRAFVAAGTLVVEQLEEDSDDIVSVGQPAFASIELDGGVLVVEGNTITLGGTETYEFVDTLGNETPGNVPIVIGTDDAAAAVNANTALNIVAQTLVAPFTALFIEAADSPGGTPVVGPGPDISLAASGAPELRWSTENLNVSGNAPDTKSMVVRIVGTAQSVDVRQYVKLPFAVTRYDAYVIRNLDGTLLGDSSVAISRVPGVDDQLLVSFPNDASPFQVGEVVEFKVYGA